MSKFDFDQRNLPDNLKPKTGKPDDYRDAVLLQLGDGVNPAPLDAFSAAIIGMLVLDGYTDQNAATFQNGFWAIRGEAAGTTTNADGEDEPNKSIYQAAAGSIAKLRGGGTVFYQELATVSRQLIQNAGAIPFGSPAFSSQIRVLDDEYVQGGPQTDSLDLPDLSGAASSATPDDLRPDNIRAVGVIWAAYNLEQMRLFDAVDRIIETWWNGQLPVGSDRGSKALDDFYWSSELRLSPAARHMQYSRVLGITGGEVSTEVQPNTGLNDNWMRVIASLAEYDRQQRIGDIVSGQRANALTLTGEQVRQAARNLAANASLYGWGGTQFAARRLAKHVQSAFDILTTPEIQAAYGVDGPYKVIERVAPEIGGTPNIVKYRTLADSGKRIFDLIAKYVNIWSGGTNNPLFSDNSQASVVNSLAAAISSLAAQGPGAMVPGPSTNGSTPATGIQADVSPQDQDEFMRQAGYVIAVQGIQDDQVQQFSQPAELQYAPSIPNLAPISGTTTNGSGQAGIDQLRQMVSQGQVPTADQLKALVLPSAN